MPRDTECNKSSQLRLTHITRDKINETDKILKLKEVWQPLETGAEHALQSTVSETCETAKRFMSQIQSDSDGQRKWREFRDLHWDSKFLLPTFPTGIPLEREWTWHSSGMGLLHGKTHSCEHVHHAVAWPSSWCSAVCDLCTMRMISAVV